MRPTLHPADVLDYAADYTGEPYHALLCDPPYHLTSITERFGKAGAAEAQYGNDGVFQRASRGFMGKSWTAAIWPSARKPGRRFCPCSTPARSALPLPARVGCIG